MESQEYNEALKRGEKAYREALSKGSYPYLQVLDEILSHVSIAQTVSLGVTEIPSDAIVGTVTAGRRTAFASNFMPLLGSNTEFATKWITLCNAHLSEGIHDPVKAYEYMNRYYILEGNKRVSVLKYFGAPTIPAVVTRYVPKRSESPENRVYFEFLDFYAKCPVNYLIFSKPGSYRAFTEAAGKQPDDIWTDEERMNLKAMYSRFTQALQLLPANRDREIPAGDAFLTYINLYGYQESLSKLPEKMREELVRIQDELTLLKKDDRVKLMLETTDAPKLNVFGRLFGIGNTKLKAAFIYNRNPANSPWTYGHELGRLSLSDQYGDEIQTVCYPDVDPVTMIDDTIETAIKDGANVIFATTRLFMEACVRAAAEHPNVRILCCTLNAAHRYIRTYYARIYEAKFLSGVIAGALVKNGKIGYLSDYPLPMNLANINAFALGVSSVNPAAKVHLKWTTEANADPGAYFRQEGITLISGREFAAPHMQEREFGLYDCSGSEPVRLAMAVYDWGTVYRKLIESIRDGSYGEDEKKSDRRALNYWWGMESDAVDLIVSGHVPETTAKLVKFLGDSIRNHTLNPFFGVIKTKTGTVGKEDEILGPESIMTMDWLAENIVGTIPDASMLNETARSLVTLQSRNTETEARPGPEA